MVHSRCGGPRLAQVRRANPKLGGQLGQRGAIDQFARCLQKVHAASDRLLCFHDFVDIMLHAIRQWRKSRSVIDLAGRLLDRSSFTETTTSAMGLPE
jgi:hypothetical protein